MFHILFLNLGCGDRGKTGSDNLKRSLNSLKTPKSGFHGGLNDHKLTLLTDFFPLLRRFQCERKSRKIFFLLFPVSLMVKEDRTAGNIDPRHKVALRGNVHVYARPQFDEGPVDPAMK